MSIMSRNAVLLEHSSFPVLRSIKFIIFDEFMQIFLVFILYDYSIVYW